MSRIDTTKITENYSVSSVVSQYVKLTKNGREYEGVCPFHNERTPSFTVNDDKGFYHCFGCGAHGDVIDFVMEYSGQSFRDACEAIAGGSIVEASDATKRSSVAVDYYDGIEAAVAPNGELWQAGKRTPKLYNPKRADDADKRWVTYKPSMVFPYLGIDGALLGYVLRVDFGDGKITPQIRYAKLPNGEYAWTHMPFAEPRPLYGMERLASGNGQVFICEGEKATDACARLLGVAAVSWPGGTNAVDKADWSPLAGRKVVIWPDADEPGWKAANRIGEILSEICGEVKIIDSRDHEVKGWDAADAEAEGMDKAAVLAWGKARISEWKPEPVEVPGYDVPPVSEYPDDAPYHPGDEAPMPDYPQGAPVSDADVEPAAPQKADEPEQDWQPFRILGHNKGTYYYLPNDTQQVVELSAAGHTKPNLIALADQSYWEQQYPKKNGADWDMAMNALMRMSARVGIFTGEKMRGRGAWVDGSRAVVHLGNVVRIDGKEYQPVEVPSDYIYEAAQPLQIRPTRAATNAEAHRLVELCERLTWENQLSAQLLAGWCVIAPVCGAMHWRPHIWVTGGAGSGKSTVMKCIIGQVVGPVAMYAEGTTTEAGLRQTLNHDARPVIFDEAESEDKASAAAMQRVLSLARISSSGGEIVKGSQDGTAKAYTIRACFCFSSINTSVSHYADETRISKLVLRKNEAHDRDEHYQNLMRDMNEWLTEDYAAKMFARSVDNITTLLKNCKTFTDAANVVVGNRRAADQIGPMLAGLYLCHTTREATFDEAVAWIRKQKWDDHAALESSNDEHKLLSTVMFHRARISAEAGGVKDVTLGELCLHATGKVAMYGVGRDEAKKELGRNGIKVEDDGNGIIIANKAPSLSKILEGTPWAKDWMRPLRSLPGAQASESKYFAPGLVQKGTHIPIELLVEQSDG